MEYHKGLRNASSSAAQLAPVGSVYPSGESSAHMLQRTIGNRAVQNLLASRLRRPTPSVQAEPVVQRKLDDEDQEQFLTYMTQANIDLDEEVMDLLHTFFEASNTSLAFMQLTSELNRLIAERQKINVPYGMSFWSDKVNMLIHLANELILSAAGKDSGQPINDTLSDTEQEETTEELEELDNAAMELPMTTTGMDMGTEDMDERSETSNSGGEVTFTSKITAINGMIITTEAKQFDVTESEDLHDTVFKFLQVGDTVTVTMEGDFVCDIEPQYPVAYVDFENDDEREASSESGDVTVLPFSVQQQDGPTCWAAVSASIAAYYDSKTKWTQSALIKSLGKAADSLDNVTIALQLSKNLDGTKREDLPFDKVISEIDGGRPIIAGMQGKGGHVVVICGYRTTNGRELLVCDPNYGGQHYWISYASFAYGKISYGLKQAPGHWDTTWTTK